MRNRAALPLFFWLFHLLLLTSPLKSSPEQVRQSSRVVGAGEISPAQPTQKDEAYLRTKGHALRGAAAASGSGDIKPTSRFSKKQQTEAALRGKVFVPRSEMNEADMALMRQRQAMARQVGVSLSHRRISQLPALLFQLLSCRLATFLGAPLSRPSAPKRRAFNLPPSNLTTRCLRLDGIDGGMRASRCCHVTRPQRKKALSTSLTGASTMRARRCARRRARSPSGRRRKRRTWTV